MEKLELRQDKKMSLIKIVLIVVVQISVSWNVFFTGDANTYFKWIFGIINLVIFLRLLLSIKSIIRNKPVLTLSKSDITIIEENKPVSYLWVQVNGWKIEKDFDGDGNYLILETAEGKKKGKIASLDMDTDEIEELINEYKNAGRESAFSNQAQ